MAEQVGPWGSKPESDFGLRVLSGDEAFLSGFHQGHAEPRLCRRRPDIRLQPHLDAITKKTPAKTGGVHIRVR
jgi:hypothetical protein